MRLAALLLLLAAGPSTQPVTDPTMSWLLSGATTAPSPADTVPTTQPSALQGGDNDLDQPRPATLTLSNGQQITGNFSTTLEQPIRVWVESEKEYHDIPFSLIQSIQAHVDWERLEPEWNFKESGSDVKIYSGKTYPARLTSYTITLTSGQVVTGAVAAPLYLNEPDGSQKIYILHKRDKGQDGQTLSDLVYVKQVEFQTPPQPAPKD